MPPFNTVAGPGMYSEGLSGFIPGVTAQVYPLKANIARLQEFCDAYLNFVGERDRPPVYFRAAAPYVLLGILNYPRMAFTVHNMGWLAQHEIVFDVLLEWYGVENGRLVFKDFAAFTPFIYVDNPLSIEGGREVYGWPKSAAQLLPVAPAPSAAAASRFFALGVSEPGRRFGAGARTLLELEREGDARNPLSALPAALARSASALWGPLEALGRAPVFGYEQPRDVRNLLAMACRGLGYAGSLLPGLLLNRPALPAHGPIDLDSPFFYLNYITLKQFRDAQEPELACYQALVRSKMVAARLNDVGLLFGLMPADLTGGISVKLHRLPDHPIIESLGLEVVEETPYGETPVATLRPAFPYWLNADLGYSTGEVLSWRGAHSAWRTPRAPQAPSPAPASAGPSAAPDTSAQARARARYNTALGRAGQEIRGPFDYPDATVHVLPLMADGGRLARFCGAYLDNERYRFEPWGSYAYFIVANIGAMASETDDFSLRAVRDAAFAFPVKWCDRQGRLLSLAMVSPFAYISDETAAITVREVSGLPALRATIETSTGWMRGGEAARGNGPARLLTISAMIFPAFDVGAEARQCTLVEVRDGDPLPAGDGARWQRVADDWGRELLADYWHKHDAAQLFADDFDNLRALALEITAHGERINSIGLKQFRDVAHYEYACYQALVLNRIYVDKVHALEEDDRRKTHLRIHRYAMQPVVELLGLKVKWTETGGDVPVDIIQPIRPFRAKLAIRERLGRNICWRTSQQWRCEDGAASPYFEHAGHRTRVGRGLVEAIDSSPEHKQLVSNAAADWLGPTVAAELRRLVRELKRQALVQLVEPLEQAPVAPAEVAEDGERGAGASHLRAALDTLKSELDRIEDLAASDDRWQAFVKLFDPEGLLRLVDRLEAAAADAGILNETAMRKRIAQERLACDEAARSIEKIEPQMVLESMLSRRWHQSVAARQQRRAEGGTVGRKPDFAIRADSIGAPVSGWPPPAPLTEAHPGLYAAPPTGHPTGARTRRRAP